MDGLKWKSSQILFFVTSDQLPNGRMKVAMDYFHIVHFLTLLEQQHGFHFKENTEMNI